MPTVLQFRRGTTSQNNSFTGSTGEITVDTTTNQLRIHDGSTAGGTTVGLDTKNIQIGTTGDNEIDTSSGNLTIDSAGGTTTIDDNLTVNGNIDVSSGTIKLDGNYPTGTDNLALGDTALDSVTSGDQNTAIGSIALTALTTASFNTAIGYKALEDNISGTKNTAIGSNAASNTTGANNVAIGVRTLFFNTSGGKNTAVGEEALLNGTSASQNTALGYQAGASVSGGSNLTILGYQAEPSSGSATNEITLGNSSVTSLRIPGLQSGASSGDVLTFDGTDIGFSTPSAGGTSWQAVKTSNFTAVAGEGYFINTTSAAITMTLPSSPSQGDEVAFVDYAGTADTNAITIARNGSNITGAASDLTVSVERAANSLVYVDATQGWLLTSK